MTPPLIGEGNNLCFCLTSVMSVAHIGPKSRTERTRKTKIGTGVAHVTRDSNTTFEVKRSRSPGHFTRWRVSASGSCSGGRGNVLVVRNCCYVAVCSNKRGIHGGERGRGISWRPPAYCLLYIVSVCSDCYVLCLHFIKPVLFITVAGHANDSTISDDLL